MKGRSISLAPLDWVWPVTLKLNESRVDYEISLCRPLHLSESDHSCFNSTVCRTENNSSWSLASFEGGFYQMERKYDFSYLILQGSQCSANPKQYHKIIFHFKCGSNLGYPEIFFNKQCETFFSWSTLVACDNLPKRKEVPCYVYDKEKGNKLDLQPLIKWKGAYRVAENNRTESLVINVCSDITADDTTNKCPPGTAACLEREGKFYSVGQLKSGLSYTRLNRLLQISYEVEGDVYPPGCDKPPTTKIMFLCPQQRNSMRGPQLISRENCQFEILWEVTYACPEEAFSGDLKTCKFTNGYHNLEFDLSPLRKVNEPYNISSKINNASVAFYLNVCGGLGDDFMCNSSRKIIRWKVTSACLVNKTQGTMQNIGTLKDARLHFVDGSITLVYIGADGCNGTNASWRTIINFICNKTAGDGMPQFTGQEECLYYFDWHTVHACPKKQEEQKCSVMNGNTEFDIKNLHREAGSEGWRVIDGTGNVHQRRQIVLNVCGFLETSGLTSKCPNDSSICLINKADGSGISLGKYHSDPEYDPKIGAVVLNYFSGHPCGTGTVESQIKLFCHIGSTGSSPILVKESKCYYEFEWYSDQACPLTKMIGKDCKIEDQNLGFLVDLSSLTFNTSYKVLDYEYMFYLNICGPVQGTECNMKGNVSKMGGCGWRLSTPNELFSLGEASSELVYNNGVFVLHYPAQNISGGSTSISYDTEIFFFCDPAAKNTRPIFVHATDRSIKFFWYTSHACLRKTYVDCLAVDPRTGVQYDLSSLTRQHGNEAWSTIDTIGKRKFYLNVCHPLGSKSHCNRSAAVCSVDLEEGTERADLPNLGQALSAPYVQSDGHLILHYNHGRECLSYGDKVNYSTIIHFICHTGNTENNIRFLGSFGPCNFSFLWATEAACPIETEVAHNVCNITDSVSGQVYDLKALKLADTFYNVSYGSRKFRLNICGSVGNNGCAVSGGKNISVCEVTENGGIKTVSLTNNYSLRVSEDLPVRLTYLNENGDDSVDIGFKCAEETSGVYFLQQRGNVYHFEIATPLACKRKAVYCLVDGPKGERYDLSPLGHMPFRIAFDTSPQMINWHYQISFCSPLDIAQSSPCYGSGACHVNLGHNVDDRSLGYQLKTPEVTDYGSVIVHFTNGSKCLERNDIKNSAEVKLLCSYKEKELVFQGVSSCHYKFLLETPAACPIQAFNGSNCSVKNLVTGHVFDLSPLRRIDSDYEVGHHEYTYHINVCAELVQSIRECDGAGVCQTKASDPQFAVNAGRPSDKLNYEDGIITLVYGSGKGNCHGRYTRTTVIKFLCDYTTTGLDGPVFVDEEDDCTYGFLWKTSYACPPHEVINCTVTSEDDRYSYQLDTLAWSSDNYYVKDPRNPNRTFAINVCRTLIPQQKFRCSPSSAACLLDRSSGNDAAGFTIGSKLSVPMLVHGKLILSYTDGEKCFSGGKEKNYETIIEFKCSPQEKFTTPEFVSQDGCKFSFLWETSAACPIARKDVVTNNCTVTNPQTGQVFNISSLASTRAVRVKVGSTQEFLVNVCGFIPERYCGYSVGACLMEKGKKVRTGYGNAYLHYRDGRLSLNYEGGDKCDGGKSERNTVIEVVCSRLEDAGPRFLSRLNDCTYNFVWYTPLACEKELPCAVDKDGVTVDLSILASGGNATIFHSIRTGSTFFLNVCRPLPYFVHSYCPSSAAICQVPFGTATALSLGRLWKSPYLDEHDQITLEYKEGSICPTSTTKRISSRIIFICDFSVGRGEPHLLELSADECEFLFEWRTEVACTMEMLLKIPSENCTFKDIDHRFTIDLSKLWKSDSPYQVKSKHRDYLINICGGTSTEGNCRGASVCSVEDNEQKNYGSVDNSTVTVNGLRVVMDFQSSEVCNANEHRSAKIIFTCDASAGIGSPTFFEEFPCFSTFLWKTSVTCPQSLPKCTLFDDRHFYDLRMFSSISHSWSVIDDRGNFYWLNICNEIRREVVFRKNQHCPSASGVCRVGKDGQGVSIGSASSQTLVANGDSADSLTLHYGNGQEICSLSDGSKVAVSTKITLICDKSVEQPTFISGPDGDCIYKFQWKTFGACPRTDQEPLMEEKGFIFDQNFPDLKMNLSAHINTPFTADEESRDKYVYLFNIGGGVKFDDKNNECYKAAVCQTKPTSDFYRDLGSLPTRRFFFQGSDIRLELTSHGKRCGKNKNKNVTTNVMFECVPDAGVGNPQFLYESNNCDYLFKWQTSAVCATSLEQRKITSNFYKPTKSGTTASVSTEAIVGLVLSLALVVVLIGVFAKRERRTTVLYKMKNCFNKVKLPRYRYIQSSHTDGDPILMSPDEPLQRFHEESDGDLVT